MGQDVLKVCCREQKGFNEKIRQPYDMLTARPDNKQHDIGAKLLDGILCPFSLFTHTSKVYMHCIYVTELNLHILVCKVKHFKCKMSKFV